MSWAPLCLPATLVRLSPAPCPAHLPSASERDESALQRSTVCTPARESPKTPLQAVLDGRRTAASPCRLPPPPAAGDVHPAQASFLKPAGLLPRGVRQQGAPMPIVRAYYVEGSRQLVCMGGSARLALEYQAAGSYFC
ncbi:hypothetical protein ABPG75_010318 [Micractinium tetrahymenae]